MVQSTLSVGLSVYTLKDIVLSLRTGSSRILYELTASTVRAHGPHSVRDVNFWGYLEERPSNLETRDLVGLALEVRELDGDEAWFCAEVAAGQVVDGCLNADGGQMMRIEDTEGRDVVIVMDCPFALEDMESNDSHEVQVVLRVRAAVVWEAD